jgi:hypothetical protein
VQGYGWPGIAGVRTLQVIAGHCGSLQAQGLPCNDMPLQDLAPPQKVIAGIGPRGANNVDFACRREA